MACLTSRSRADHRLFIIEFLAVFLWVTSSLSAYFFTATPLLHTLSPSLRSLPPARVFLSLLVVIMAIWELLDLSLGSPFNPAITLSLTIAGDIPHTHAAVMAPAQFLAHLVAVLAVRNAATIFHLDTDGVFHPPQPHHAISYQKAVCIEALITALMCAVALSLKHVFHEKAKFKKWSIMTILIVALLDLAGEWTGGCMNPAMSLALAAFEGHWAAHSVYWIGPLLGAVAAGVAHNRIFVRRKPSVDERIEKAKVQAEKDIALKKSE